MKNIYLSVMLAVAGILVALPSSSSPRADASPMVAQRSLEGRIPGMHRLDQSVVKDFPVLAAPRSLSDRLSRQAVTYNWQKMDGNATFHDDYAKCEFNLQTVDYPTGILKATNATDVYALRPYGTTYPYYNDLLQSGMINSSQGAMIIEAADYDYVKMPMFATGTTITWDDGTTEDIMMASLAWVMEFIGHESSVVKASGLGGKNEAGHIYFPCTESVVYTTQSILSGAEQNGNILNGFYACDKDGLYGFYLPGVTPPGPGDIGVNEIQLSTPKYCFDNNKIVLHMKAGSNIKIFKLGFYSKVSDDMFDDVISNGQGGQYLAEGDLTLDAQGTATGNCHIYIAVVAGDAQGNIKDAQFIECYLVPDDADAWEAPQNAILTDGIVAPMYQLNVPRYDVKYQRAKTNPGYIRVVNPYKKNWPYLDQVPPFSGHSHDHYLYLNATDPSAVVLESAPLGLVVDTAEGEAKASSYAAYYMDIEGKTLAEVKGAGHTGTYSSDSKTITFPAKSLLYANCKYKNGNYFTTNPNGEFRLELDKTLGVGTLDAEDVNAAATYYNLQGQRVADPASAPGVYIRTLPGQPAARVLIK